MDLAIGIGVSVSIGVGVGIVRWGMPVCFGLGRNVDSGRSWGRDLVGRDGIESSFDEALDGRLRRSG